MNTFKLFLYALTISLFFVSCSDDDEPTENSSIVGEWAMTEYTGSTTASVTSTIAIATSLNAVGSNFDCITTFTENPNLVSSTGSFDIDVNVIVSMGGVEMTNTSNATTADYDEAGNEELSWSVVNENELVTPLLIPENLPEGVTVDLDNVKTEIIELTATTLKLKLTGEYTITNNGISTEVELEYFATYTRQ